MALSPQVYEFSFEGGENNSYLFQTTLGVVYEVKFKPSTYLFEGTIFSDHTFELAILIAINPLNRMPPFDSWVANTVASIFYDFYTKSDEQIVVYICDSSDKRQVIRQKKFDRWFKHFNGTGYLKMDETLKDIDGGEFFVALIIKRQNPYRVQIFDAFTQLLDSYNSGK